MKLHLPHGLPSKASKVVPPDAVRLSEEQKKYVDETIGGLEGKFELMMSYKTTALVPSLNMMGLGATSKLVGKALAPIKGVILTTRNEAYEMTPEEFDANRADFIEICNGLDKQLDRGIKAFKAVGGD